MSEDVKELHNIVKRVEAAGWSAFLIVESLRNEMELVDGINYKSVRHLCR